MSHRFGHFRDIQAFPEAAQATALICRPLLERPPPLQCTAQTAHKRLTHARSAPVLCGGPGLLQGRASMPSPPGLQIPLRRHILPLHYALECLLACAAFKGIWAFDVCHGPTWPCVASCLPSHVPWQPAIYPRISPADHEIHQLSFKNVRMCTGQEAEHLTKTASQRLNLERSPREAAGDCRKAKWPYATTVQPRVIGALLLGLDGTNRRPRKRSASRSTHYLAWARLGISNTRPWLDLDAAGKYMDSSASNAPYSCQA